MLLKNFLTNDTFIVVILIMITSDGINQNIIVNVNGYYFKFIDVPGDGDCFFHSMLQEKTISYRFKDVQAIRFHLRGMVSDWYHNDYCLQQIFKVYESDISSWCCDIVKEHRWATSLDMLLFSYVTKVNVVIVGNYTSNFEIHSNQYLLINQLKLNVNVSMYGTIHILYHIFKHPLYKMQDGNHFAYLKPVIAPTIRIEINTIKNIDMNIYIQMRLKRNALKKI